MTNTQAAERQAKRECLVTELVEALEALVALRGPFPPSDEAISAAWAKADAALARAKEQQQ
ncbi:hypothetical protein NDR89_23290 [Cupriavidus gilardii]|uniref:Uncharacterized protein n=1 Tax=Cupriavidus gilardii TaxID=82541 RepID=A0ABY4VQQ1_9BURK|nr:hypothetical protein [Cupriavidus gilardii]USE79519.1 hypothetical protein NDR89_23290 [Cupriavidus gilardii]